MDDVSFGAQMTSRSIPYRVVIKWVSPLAALALLACILPAAASATFGLKKNGTKVVIAGAGGSTLPQAGWHPGSIQIEFNLKTVPNPVPGEDHNLPISDESPLRNATVEAPPGLTGDPTAVPRCSLADLIYDGT